MGWLLVAAWGGLVGLDGTSLLQVMVSRPLPAAALAGLLLGNPVAGAIVGAVLETFALCALPIGAARNPEAGTAAVAAAAGYAFVVGPAVEPELVLVAVLFGLVWQWVTGLTVDRIRHLNERIAAVPARSEPVTAAWIVRRHMLAIGVDFLRAAAVTVVGWLLAVAALRAASPIEAQLGPAAGGILGVATTGMVAAALGVFGGFRERRTPFLLGLLGGLALLLAR